MSNLTGYLRGQIVNGKNKLNKLLIFHVEYSKSDFRVFIQHHGQVKRLALFLFAIDKTIVWSYDVGGGFAVFVGESAGC